MGIVLLTIFLGMIGLSRCCINTWYVRMCDMRIFFVDLPAWGAELWHYASLKH